VRLTSRATCGTDLHIIRGTLSGMKKGTILGHESVGAIEAYEAFDQRQPGWIKVELLPKAS
jgi:threonine dehydrogenase-like Zn-dependent dehydrogenase